MVEGQLKNLPFFERIFNKKYRDRSYKYLKSLPGLAVEGAVLDGFGDVFDLDIVAHIEISEGTGNSEDAVIGTGAEVEIRKSQAQQVLACLIKRTESLDFFGGHVGIAAGRGISKAELLAFAGGIDTSSDGCRIFTFGAGHELILRNRQYFDMNVDTIKQWP